MKTFPVAIVRLAAIAAISTVLSGCAPSDPPGTVVKGRIVENGEPILAPRADVGVGIVEIEFYPVGPPEGRLGAATVAKGDGTFQLVGAGSGVPAGEYSVVLFKRENEVDYFKGKFSKDATPIKVTVPAEGGEHDLGDIDVGKY